MGLTSISLFSGASGSDLAFREEGFSIRAAVELDGIACDTYAKNLGVRPYCMSVRSFLNHMQGIQRRCQQEGLGVLIGGPPCQSFSNANHSNYVSMDGMQNIYDFIECVKRLRPRYFIMEQAPTLLEMRMRPLVIDLEQMMCGLADGYHVEIVGLNAMGYGAGQDRLRTFFLGSALGFPVLRKPAPVTSVPVGWLEKLTTYLGSFVCDASDLLIAKSNDVKGRNIMEPSYTVMASQLMCIRKMNANVPKMAKSISTLKRTLLGIEQRYLTIKECQVLQGFPPEYEFCGNSKQQLRQIGNAWSVDVARALAKEVKCLLQKS